MDELNKTIATGNVGWFTVERAMLASIILLQAVILLWMWREHSFRFAGNVASGSSTVAGVSQADHYPGHRVAPPVYPPVTAREVKQRRPSFAQLREADRMLDQMDAIFESAINDFGRLDMAMTIDDGWDGLMVSPAMDMKEQEHNYVVVLSLPGARAHDVAVTIEGRILTVITAVHGRNEFGGEAEGTFRRAIQLPGPVGSLQLAQATMTNGILRVSIPKNGGVESDGKPLKLL